MKQGFDNILGSKTFKMLKNSILNGKHPYVDIGGIKWATINVGATSVTDYGLLFQWGDTQGYTASQVGDGEGQKNFGWNDCKYYNGDTDTFTKYNNTDGLTTLEASDDAVHVAWGGSWRMPTVSEFIALGNATTSAWTENYQGSGVNGMVLTDNTDSSKELFFPACGYAEYGSMYGVGKIGIYWSNSLKNNNEYDSYGFSFDSCGIHWQDGYYRCISFAVRGVLCV